jgi:hypothetical protein
LAASGFDSVEVRLYTEKLISRRDRMISDLGLEEEIGLLRPDGVRRNFNYDPRDEGPLTIQFESGEEIRAHASGKRVVDGRITRP